MVQKKNGKWRMCIDFTNLNKACPKDNFPLPRVDKTVDSATGCEAISLLDYFLGYHQIYMKEEDKVKTSFTRPSAHTDSCECVKASKISARHFHGSPKAFSKVKWIITFSLMLTT
jgi:hypothetical protein